MELLLISASSRTKHPVDCELIYRLDEETNGQGLPVIQESHLWAGNNISALRDRLMIEWVMSFTESKKLFDKMVNEITTFVQKHKSFGNSKSTPAVICVGVTCSNGAQLSPCFVEQLYEYFSIGPVLVRGLKVSSFPVYEKMEFDLDEVFAYGSWFSFNTSDNSTCEKQFCKDPFASNVNITHMDLVVDFESGTAYNSRRKKNYYIRCSRLTESKTKCWSLSDIGYKSASRSFLAAGIQPYSVHPVTGEAVFLLGRITYNTEDWCDFGGLKSSHWVRREKPRYTAARECFEETLGILGTTEELAEALKDFKTNNCFKVLNDDTHYVEHFMRIPYHDYPGIFQSTLRSSQYQHIEVDEMKWFSLTALKMAVRVASSEGNMRHITANALQDDGSVDDCSYPLRAPFVITLSIADALNFLDSIAAIARHVHSRNQTSLATASSSSSTDEASQLQTVLDQGSDSEAGHTERTSGDDTLIPEDREHSMQSSVSSVNDSLVVDTGKVSSDLDQGHKDTELEDEESEVKTKPSILRVISRQKKRVKNQPKKGRHHTEPTATPPKQSKRKHKQLLLYGMGAGYGYE